MNNNKLCEDIDIDIKIEKGLKILQFGSEYLLRKNYFGNCPLNSSSNHAENIKMGRIAEQDIIAELNCQLAYPAGSLSASKFKVEEKRLGEQQSQQSVKDVGKSEARSKLRNKK